ncbi:uncharacterized protein METZ01_LOCUS159968 [marine metagenome]|uniref:Uncharacterized protein n=1 Tax=marine metagenome TaxID=408172 RepID=A0A382B0I8_9ZZZZ
MNTKDKFLFGLLLLLFIGAFYFQFLTEKLNLRMDELNLADKEHVEIVLDQFSDSLRVYNLRFIGRGKHLRKAQKDIVSNMDLIEKNTDSLASMIDDVGYKLENFVRDTEKKFRNLENDLDDLSTDTQGKIRKLKQGISDLEQKSSTIAKRLKEIENLALIQNAKAKEAEEKKKN